VQLATLLSSTDDVDVYTVHESGDVALLIAVSKQLALAVF
jgi:hypothetical protein